MKELVVGNKRWLLAQPTVRKNSRSLENAFERRVADGLVLMRKPIVSSIVKINSGEMHFNIGKTRINIGTKIRRTGFVMAGHWGQLANCQMASIDSHTTRHRVARDRFPSFSLIQRRDKIKRKDIARDARRRAWPSIYHGWWTVCRVAVVRTFWLLSGWSTRREATTTVEIQFFHTHKSPTGGTKTQDIFEKSWLLTDRIYICIVKEGKRLLNPDSLLCCLWLYTSLFLFLSVCELYIFKSLVDIINGTASLSLCIAPEGDLIRCLVIIFCPRPRVRARATWFFFFCFLLDFLGCPLDFYDFSTPWWQLSPADSRSGQRETPRITRDISQLVDGGDPTNYKSQRH